MLLFVEILPCSGYRERVYFRLLQQRHRRAASWSLRYEWMFSHSEVITCAPWWLERQKKKEILVALPAFLSRWLKHYRRRLQWIRILFLERNDSFHSRNAECGVPIYYMNCECVCCTAIKTSFDAHSRRTNTKCWSIRTEAVRRVTSSAAQSNWLEGNISARIRNTRK